MRQAILHWRGRWPVEKITVNSDGISGYSAIIFTPPSDISVIIQSRGNPPVPNWILAKFLHTRRSLLRRFANITTPEEIHPTITLVYRRIVGIGLAEPVALSSKCNDRLAAMLTLHARLQAPSFGRLDQLPCLIEHLG